MFSLQIVEYQAKSIYLCNTKTDKWNLILTYFFFTQNYTLLPMAWMKFSFFGNSNNTKSLDELRKEKGDIVKAPHTVKGGKINHSEDRPWGGGVSSVPFKQ